MTLLENMVSVQKAAWLAVSPHSDKVPRSVPIRVKGFFLCLSLHVVPSGFYNFLPRSKDMQIRSIVQGCLSICKNYKRATFPGCNHEYTPPLPKQSWDKIQASSK